MLSQKRIQRLTWLCMHYLCSRVWYKVWFMVFNATFNNISVMLWRSVLLVEETGVRAENHRPVASQWQTLYHNFVSSTPRLNEIWTHKVCGEKHWSHQWSGWEVIVRFVDIGAIVDHQCINFLDNPTWHQGGSNVGDAIVSAIDGWLVVA